MPRAAFVARTTFVCAAASLFPTLTPAGYVQISAPDVVPENVTHVAQPLVDEARSEPQVSFSFDDGSTREDLMDETNEQRGIVLEGPIAVPLPGPLWAGLIGLATAVLAKGRRRTRS